MPRLPNSHQFLWSFVSVTLRQAGHGFLRACDVVGYTNNNAHPHLQPDGLLDPSDENEERLRHREVGSDNLELFILTRREGIREK